MTLTIQDYITNIIGKPTRSIMYIEDYIEMSPTQQDQIDSIYRLYEVEFTDTTKQFFVTIESRSASTTIPAPDDLMQQYFPDRLKNGSSSKNTN